MPADVSRTERNGATAVKGKKKSIGIRPSVPQRPRQKSAKRRPPTPLIGGQRAALEGATARIFYKIFSGLPLNFYYFLQATTAPACGMPMLAPSGHTLRASN